MGAEQSGLASDVYKGELSKGEMAGLKAAEKTRKASLRKSKSKSSFMGDVTAYPKRSYKASELQEISSTLGDRLDKLNRKMTKLAADDLAGYIKAYTTIKEGRDATALASKIPQHKGLNRYNNIVAYDHTRVTLRPTPEIANSDYINANYINGYNHPNRYIATQGPIPDSFNAFWQMIWENKVPTIVMVTNEVENGKLKCHRYWPEADEPGAIGMYGQYEVTHTSQEVFPLYLKRTFNITHGREVRPLVQYCYTAWPDHGVPQTTDELLQFRTTVRKAHNDDQSMVVHCSAGVGRTGTFIGMDRYLDSCSNLDAKQDDDVHKIVRDLRSSRNFMVQAQAQYVYLYEACRDGLTRLHQKAAREAAMAAKDEKAREEQIVSELEADVARGEAAIRETHRQWQVKLHSDGAKIIDPDVSQAYIAATPYTADIHTTSRLGQDARRESLAASTAQWVERQNVPLSPEDHGYQDPTAAPLTSRLMALSDARTAWMTRYGEAERTWSLAHDEAGVQYDIGEQMTPLESRVSSLASAEEAWMLRSGSALTLAEERARIEVNDLTQRLESLQYTVLNTERRWRSAGHGFAASNQGPNGGDQDGGRINTSERLGGLTDRLAGLQMEQMKYEKQKKQPEQVVAEFHEDISAQAVKQDSLMLRRQKAAAEADAAEAAAEAAKAAEDKAARDAEVKAQFEASRKQKIKDRAVKSHKAFNFVDPTEPNQKRRQAAKKQAEEDALAAEVDRMEAEEAALAEQERQAKLAKKAKASKQAKKFVNAGK